MIPSGLELSVLPPHRAAIVRTRIAATVETIAIVHDHIPQGLAFDGFGWIDLNLCTL
jgi:hypothetical protein